MYFIAVQSVESLALCVFVNAEGGTRGMAQSGLRLGIPWIIPLAGLNFSQCVSFISLWAKREGGESFAVCK